MRWTDEQAEPRWASAVVLRRTSDFTIDGFCGRQGRAAIDAPAIVLDDAVEGTVAGARGSAGCRRLIHVQGDGSRAIAIRDCSVPERGTVVTYADGRLRRAVKLT